MRALLLALLLDKYLGEPPAPLHPVVWMGKLLDGLEAGAPRTDRARFAFGLVVAVGLPLAWGSLAALLDQRLAWPIKGVLLKATFAGHGLLEAARRVECSLDHGQVEDARRELRWLVSRPTDRLDESLISAAAIESLAENYVDSWVAPLAAYCLFGLGGAYAYRAANTADAMWGYRTADYEWLGKGVAGLDDVLNWLPARLGALLLVLSGPRPRAALAVWWRDASLTASPNAGQPMSVAAGHLDRRLEKPGQYILHRTGSLPSTSDVAAARRLVSRAMLVAACLSLLQTVILSLRRIHSPRQTTTHPRRHEEG
jgi:adenosylcobinamide-phosphate synthase